MEELKAEWDTCTQCPFHVQRKNVVVGDGNPATAEVFAVGQTPGKDEDIEGIPFVGAGGIITKRQFQIHGVPDELMWWTNVLACMPFNYLKGAVRKSWMEHCWDRLDGELRIVKPKFIVAMGRPAAVRFVPNLPAKGETRGKDFIYKGIPGRTIVHPAILNRMQKKGPKDYAKALADVTDDMLTVKQRLIDLEIIKKDP